MTFGAFRKMQVWQEIRFEMYSYIFHIAWHPLYCYCCPEVVELIASSKRTI